MFDQLFIYTKVFVLYFALETIVQKQVEKKTSC